MSSVDVTVRAASAVELGKNGVAVGTMFFGHVANWPSKPALVERLATTRANHNLILALHNWLAASPYPSVIAT